MFVEEINPKGPDLEQIREQKRTFDKIKLNLERELKI